MGGFYIGLMGDIFYSLCGGEEMFFTLNLHIITGLAK